MTNSVTIGLIITGIILSIGIVVYTVSFNQQNFKTIEIGGIAIAKVPKDTVVEFIDAASASEINKLNKEKKLEVFNGFSLGMTSKKYKEAENNARGGLSKYLHSKVITFQSKIDRYISKNYPNISTNVKNTIFNSSVKILSESQQFAAKVIARYYMFKMGEKEYHTLLLYDPDTAEIMFQKEIPTIINSIEKNAHNKGFIISIKDFFKNAFLKTGTWIKQLF